MVFSVIQWDAGDSEEAGYPREIDSVTFSLGWDFDIWVLPWGREFDVATILEDRNNLETSRRHFDHSAFPAQLRAKERFLCSTVSNEKLSSLTILFSPLLKQHLKLTAQKAIKPSHHLALKHLYFDICLYYTCASTSKTGSARSAVVASSEQVQATILVNNGNIQIGPKVSMWFEHLQSVQQNRKRGASKAAKTRKQRRLPKRRENQSSEVCQIFKSEDPDDDQEEIVWIQCDTCNLWYHQTCVIESWPPSLCPADDAIFWDCGSCKHHLRLTINHY
ncbi:uncharacterized protein [Acropora muricata]|uniref:uncharacterized protein n=2 Tax=Acropora TaxID=6127 RepID=UPI0034E4119C